MSLKLIYEDIAVCPKCNSYIFLRHINFEKGGTINCDSCDFVLVIEPKKTNSKQQEEKL